jgi:hypothetical protein
MKEEYERIQREEVSARSMQDLVGRSARAG